MRQKTKKRMLEMFKRLAVVAAIIGLLFGLAQLSLPSMPKTDQIKAYFFNGEKLIGVKQELKAGEVPLTRALQELEKGPGQGLSTLIPKGTKILGIRQDKKVAIVNFNNKLEQYGGGSARVQGMLAQIVYTATSVKGVDKVFILINGKSELVLGGEGFIVNRPLSRRDISR